MKNLPEDDKKQKIPHPVAQLLEKAILKRLEDKQNELGLSDLKLGEKTYSILGYDDPQKKINNTLRGKTGIKLSDFYIICEGLGLAPDRVFCTALDKVLDEMQGIAPPEEKSETVKPPIPLSSPQLQPPEIGAAN